MNHADNIYLAVDIGASSGRHILGTVKEGKLCLKEIYRFENGVKQSENGLIWDEQELFNNVLAGIRECKKAGKIPKSISIDTWGVDYVLLDSDGREMKPVYAYRNSRTDSVPNSGEFPVTAQELYASTGIQALSFNTVYQLYCDKKSGKLDNAAHFLMIPDYLAYRLTGVMVNEYTNATTTGIVNARTKQFDTEILNKLGIKADLFKPLSLPGTPIGNLKPEIAKEVGFDCKVVACGSHDTASAVAACPIDDNSMYISSGTWSLIGTENTEPITTDESREANFTNEGGIEYRYRYLKNIMGMWLFQNIRRNLNKKYSYDDMMNMAMRSGYDKKIDPNDKMFVAPENMVEAVRQYLGEPDLPVADVIKSVYISIAQSYNDTVRQIERICGKSINSILIVGGGSKDKYLNRLTAEFTGKRVLTGLSEGTATGNIAAQIMADKKIPLKEVRQLIKKSFDIKEI